MAEVASTMSTTEDTATDELRTDYQPCEGLPLKAFFFAKGVIEGPGGMNDFERCEIVSWEGCERVVAAHWMLKCLANIDCEGSEEAVASILEKRRMDTLAKGGRA